MTLPTEFDFQAEIVGVLDLVALDTTAGVLRFIVGEDGWFKDTSGNVWTGSKLISTSDMEISVNGTAPTMELGLSFVQDPDEEDLVAAVQGHGVAAIKNRDAVFSIQYLATTGQYFRPIYAPVVLTKRKMIGINYSFEGPQVRRLSVSVEGPFNLRAKMPGGRYNTVDHSRRVGAPNPSLEFMPTNSFDEQSLFGL